MVHTPSMPQEPLAKEENVQPLRYKNMMWWVVLDVRELSLIDLPLVNSASTPHEPGEILVSGMQYFLKLSFFCPLAAIPFPTYTLQL